MDSIDSLLNKIIFNHWSYMTFIRLLWCITSPWKFKASDVSITLRCGGIAVPKIRTMVYDGNLPMKGLDNDGKESQELEHSVLNTIPVNEYHSSRFD